MLGDPIRAVGRPTGGGACLLCVLVLACGELRPREALPAEPAGDLRTLADACLARWPDPSGLAWSWGEGVLMYGLLRAGEALAEARYLDYVRAYVDAHVASDGSLDVWFLYPDRITPGIVVAELYRRTGEERYRAAVAGLAGWLLEAAPRSGDGGWNHFPVGDIQYVDTLFMTTVFLAAAGQGLGRPDYVRESLRQHEIMGRHLFSETDGLFWHGYDEDGLINPWLVPGTHRNGAFWARGNGWAAASMVRVLGAADPAWPEYAPVRARLARQLARLAALQDSRTGHWWTVADAPEALLNYPETTATALIAEAMLAAERAELVAPLPRGAVDRALTAVRQSLHADDRGRLHVVGGSVGTHPSDYWGYVLIPRRRDRPWTVGAALMLLARVTEGGELGGREVSRPYLQAEGAAVAS